MKICSTRTGRITLLLLSTSWIVGTTLAFVQSPYKSKKREICLFACKGDDNNGAEVVSDKQSRRNMLKSTVGSLLVGGMNILSQPKNAYADAAAVQDSLDIDTFVRTGVDLGGTMGVSSQAGKSRPQTGVVFRDGTEVGQDKSGSVSAEILTGTKADPLSVLVSFISPWKLERGPVFDIECRDVKTGDGVFVAVTQSLKGRSIADLPSSFFLERLFDPTGRFSFYGPPTDIKVKNSRVDGNKRYIELSFSNLSQSTNAEIPRKALLVATTPEGSDNAIMLVGSSQATRWKNKGSGDTIKESVESFRAIPAPKSRLKVRAKDRSDKIEF